MSLIFYDHLVVFTKVEKHLKKINVNDDEKSEIWKLIDEMVHHRALTTVLNKLPFEEHNEFLDRFHKAPHDLAIIEYVNSKVGSDITKDLQKDFEKLEKEILDLLSNG